jgi:hypothetical protein
VTTCPVCGAESYSNACNDCFMHIVAHLQLTPDCNPAIAQHLAGLAGRPLEELTRDTRRDSSNRGTDDVLRV